MSDTVETSAKVLSFISKFKTIMVMGLLLAASIGTNTWLLMGKGINVHHSYDQRSYHYQNQSQAQAQLTILLQSVSSAQGKLTWKVVDLSTVDYLSVNEPIYSRLEKYLTTLDPGEALLSRILPYGNDLFVIVPVFEKK